MSEYGAHGPDWLPRHCLICNTYMGHDEAYFAECPELCMDHDEKHPTHMGGYRCPACGHQWQITPPKEWDGTLLCESEPGPIYPPPIEHADSLETSSLYYGPKWTAEKVFDTS